MARQRLGPAEAYSKRGDGGVVEEAETLRLAALINTEKVLPAPKQWRS